MKWYLPYPKRWEAGAYKQSLRTWREFPLEKNKRSSLLLIRLEISEIIGESKHQIPLQYHRLQVLDVQFIHIALNAGVLFEQVEYRKLNLRSLIFEEFLRNPPTP